MPIVFEQLPDEPIVVANLRERLDRDAVRQVFVPPGDERADGLAGLPTYRIANFLNVDVSFRELAAALVEASRGVSSVKRDPRVVPVMVAGRNRVRFFFDLLRRKEFGGVDMPVFESLDDALSYVRTLIAEQRERSSGGGV